MFKKSHHRFLSFTLLFGSCTQVDDQTDDDDEGPNGGEYQLINILLVLQELPLLPPLFLCACSWTFSLLRSWSLPYSWAMFKSLEKFTLILC